MPFRKNHFKFTEKTQSVKGRIALGLSAFLLILYAVMFYLAFRSYGNLSMYFGSVGIVAIILTIVSLVLSVQSMREENSFQFIPRLSMVITIIEALCWFGTFILGMRG